MDIMKKFTLALAVWVLAAGTALAGVTATAVFEVDDFVAKDSGGNVLDFIDNFEGLLWTGSADEDVTFDNDFLENKEPNSTTGVDHPVICVGDDCDQITENDFPVISGVPVGNYSTADQLEVDAPITRLGSFGTPAHVGNGAYCGIATGEHEASANSNNGLESLFILGEDTAITFEGTFRVYAEAYISGDDIHPSKASAAHDFRLTITNVETNSVVFDVEPDELNQTVSANAGLGTLQVTGNNQPPGTALVFPFSVTTDVLQAGTRYQLSIRNNVNADTARVDVPIEVLGCRLTGGGVSSSTLDTGEVIYVWDGTDWQANQPDDENRYQLGGQVGANTALPPQPKGEWQHHQQRGPFGSFSFHGGTASAPAGTEIIEIRCSDPGGCFPSGNPPSPNKQLDFDGIGTFSNIAGGGRAPNWLIPGATVTAEGRGNRDFDGTFHYFEVNVDDLGEGPDPAEGDDVACPPEGFGEKGDPTLPANCDCPDFYRITIYDGVPHDEVVWSDVDGDGVLDIDPSSLKTDPTTDIIYEVDGYLGRGGNGLQLHDLTGFDRIFP